MTFKDESSTYIFYTIIPSVTEFTIFSSSAYICSSGLCRLCSVKSGYSAWWEYCTRSVQITARWTSNTAGTAIPHVIKKLLRYRAHLIAQGRRRRTRAPCGGWAGGDSRSGREISSSGSARSLSANSRHFVTLAQLVCTCMKYPHSDSERYHRYLYSAYSLTGCNCRLSDRLCPMLLPYTQLHGILRQTHYLIVDHAVQGAVFVFASSIHVPLQHIDFVLEDNLQWGHNHLPVWGHNHLPAWNVAACCLLYVLSWWAGEKIGRCQVGENMKNYKQSRRKTRKRNRKARGSNCKCTLRSIIYLLRVMTDKWNR